MYNMLYRVCLVNILACSQRIESVLTVVKRQLYRMNILYKFRFGSGLPIYTFFFFFFSFAYTTSPAAVMKLVVFFRSSKVKAVFFFFFFFFSFANTTSAAVMKLVVFFRSSKPPYNFGWSGVADGLCAIRSGWCLLHLWRTCSVVWSSSPQGHVGGRNDF